MIIKQTILNIYYGIKKKLIQFKKWIVVLIFGATVVAAPLIVPPQVPDVALEKIQAKYEKSELKGKYRLEKTAFILDAVDENAIQAEVGNKNSDEFVPELTLRKWDDEVNFKVKYKKPVEKRLFGKLKGLMKKDKVDLESDKIKWKGDKTEAHFYEMKKGEKLLGKELENDVYEIEVVLLEKPNTNIVEFDIETKGLKFYYQPELKDDEEGLAEIMKQEKCTLLEAKRKCRPENVVGSYAVYHESKQGDYSKMGRKNYRAGKAFHIYRPKIVDSAGKEVWGKLNIDEKKKLLTVEIPQEFLDNAVYPVRHAAGLTFGYTSAGGSNAYVLSGEAVGTKFTASETGTGDSMSIYLEETGGNNNARAIKCSIYDSSENLITNGTTAEETNILDGTPDWFTMNFGTSPSFASGTNRLVFFHNGQNPPWGDPIYNYYYDTGATNQTGYDEGNTYSTFPDPFSASSNDTKKLSIYCTYTAGGGASRRIFLVE